MSLNLRRHYPVLLALIFVLVFLLLLLGSQRVVAYTTSPVEAEESQGIDYSAGVDLFDVGTVHSIQILISEEDYDRMVSTYQNTGEKDYFQADVIIDGVRIEDVGLRLKGNASLMSALGGMGSMPGRMAGQGDAQPPQGVAPGEAPGAFQPEDRPAMPAFDASNPPAGFDPQGALQGALPPQMPGAGLGQGSAPGGMTAQSGEVKVPLLIKFDEYVSGQTYQGHARLALRTYGITYDEAMLAEPVTNYAFELMGLPATQTAYAGLQINSEAETLYVISEVVDDPAYLEAHFSNPDGVLYKAEVGSSLTYVGDDPSSYMNSFSQETRQNDADYAALIDFARFLSESDDATFASGLAERLDVESFATYLAITNLLVNNDSIAGMNNNYYLYYDDLAGRFTLLYWDGNESLGGLGQGESASADLYFENGTTRFGMGGTQNILMTRFLAADEFRALYEEKLKLVYETAFSSGALETRVRELSSLIHAVNDERGLVTIEAFDQSVEETLSFLENRQEYLQTTSLLSQ